MMVSPDNNQLYDESNSIILNLETLRTTYKNLLIQYQQAVANYVNYLQQNPAQPCSSYSANSTGISQECYNDIWQKSGCGSGTIGYPSASASWQQSQTMNGLIQDSWYWATMTDSNHRDGCYGPDNTNYNTTTAPNFNINAPQLTTMPGKQFLGTSALSQNNSATLNDCIASCASNPMCSGATYNETNYKQPMCFLRTGDGNLVDGLSSDVAIVPQGKQLLSIVQNINNQLNETNTQIVSLTEEANPTYNELNSEKETENEVLVKQYAQLNVERVKIDKMMKEYESLDQSQSEGTLDTNKNYYVYILLCIIAILMVFLFIKFGSSAEPVASGTIYQSGGGFFY
jgi:hypothetical protein